MPASTPSTRCPQEVDGAELPLARLQAHKQAVAQLLRDLCTLIASGHPSFRAGSASPPLVLAACRLVGVFGKWLSTEGEQLMYGCVRFVLGALQACAWSMHVHVHDNMHNMTPCMAYACAWLVHSLCMYGCVRSVLGVWGCKLVTQGCRLDAWGYRLDTGSYTCCVRYRSQTRRRQRPKPSARYACTDAGSSPAPRRSTVCCRRAHCAPRCCSAHSMDSAYMHTHYALRPTRCTHARLLWVACTPARTPHTACTQAARACT